MLLPAERALNNPSKTPDAAVIWLHGLGASGNDFVPIVPHLGLPQDLSVRFVFPHAPARPVTINGVFVMPAWYDIYEMSLDRKIDLVQIEESSDQVKAWVNQLVRDGIAHERIILAGFSQGGAVAYHAALTSTKPLAGLMTLSTYFATSATVQPIQPKSLPIQITHGTRDPVVPFQLAGLAEQKLKTLGYEQIKTHSYPSEHTVAPTQIRDMGAFITKCLA